MSRVDNLYRELEPFIEGRYPYILSQDYSFSVHPEFDGLNESEALMVEELLQVNISQQIQLL